MAIEPYIPEPAPFPAVRSAKAPISTSAHNPTARMSSVSLPSLLSALDDGLLSKWSPTLNPSDVGTNKLTDLAGSSDFDLFNQKWVEDTRNGGTDALWLDSEDMNNWSKTTDGYGVSEGNTPLPTTNSLSIWVADVDGKHCTRRADVITFTPASPTSGARIFTCGYGSVDGYANWGTTLDLRTNGWRDDYQWNHYVVTADATSGTMYLYKNGVQIKTSARTLPETTATRWTLTAWNDLTDGAGRGARCYLDTIRVYDRALSPAEALQLYEAGRNEDGLTAPPTPTPPIDVGLIGHWSPTLDNSGTAPTVDRVGNSNLLDPAQNGYYTAETGSGGTYAYYTPNTTRSLYHKGLEPEQQTTGDITISMWANAGNVLGTKYCFGYTNPSVSTSAGVRIRVAGDGSGTLQLYVEGTTNVSTAAVDVDPAVWNHLAVTSEDGSSDYRIFIDGVLTDTVTAVPRTTTPTDIALGAAPDTVSSASSAEGHWDTLRLYNRVLSDSEILQLSEAGRNEQFETTPPIDVGLVAHYSPTLQADSGASLLDRIGDNDLPLGSELSWIANGEANGDWAILFTSGNDANKTLGPAVGTALPQIKSGSFWYKRTSDSTTTEYLFDCSSPTRNIFASRSGSSDLDIGVYDGTTWGRSGYNYNLAGPWTHYVYVWNGTDWDIWLNGVNVATAPSGAFASGATGFTLGNRVDLAGSAPIKGLLDTVRLYDRELQPSDIQTLYEIGRREEIIEITFNAAWASNATTVIQRTI